MDAAVELGAVTTREGAALHPVNGCRWSRLLPLTDGTLVELTKANANRCCKTIACRKAIRAALEAARTANDEQTEYSYAAKIDKINVDARLTALVNLFLTAAEMVREAELKARFSRPAVVETPAVEVNTDDLLALIDETPVQLTPLGVAAKNIGADTTRQRPTNVTKISRRKRLALANSFATAA